MLLHGHVTVLDLLMAHDASSDGSLGVDEFLRMVRGIVADDHAWQEGGAHHASIKIFHMISGGDGSVDIEELEAWIIKGVLEHSSSHGRPQRLERSLTRSESLPALAPSATQDQKTSGASLARAKEAELRPWRVRRRERRRPGSNEQPETESTTEEQSAESSIGDRALALRWLVRNASVDGVLDIRSKGQIRVVPGAVQEVAPAKLPFVAPGPPRLPRPRRRVIASRSMPTMPERG
jgi:hypothetical protein